MVMSWPDPFTVGEMLLGEIISHTFFEVFACLTFLPARTTHQRCSGQRFIRLSPGRVGKPHALPEADLADFPDDRFFPRLLMIMAASGAMS